MERRQLYGGGIAVAGLVLTVAQFAQGIQQLDGYAGTTGVLVFTFETLPFVLIGGALVYVGSWLSTQESYEPDLPRVVGWGAGSTLLFASVAALLLFSQEVTFGGNTLDQAPYVAVNHVTVGAIVGVLVGIYDARSRIRQRELERECDRVEQFARKAAAINNYGRELNRSDSIDQVSSLCLQAMGTLLGLTEFAFVITDGDESEFVDTTVLNVPDDALVGLARDSLDQAQATVVTHESLPAEFDERAGDAISLLVTDHDESAVVLLALTDDASALDEEAVELLEMLVSHAATALDRIFESRLSATTEQPG